MSEALKKIRRIILGVLSIELAIYIASVLFYFYDVPVGFHDYMDTEAWVLTLGCSIIVDLSLFWIGYLRLSRIRQKTDLSAASLLGGDVQEAYNFGEIALVVTDEKGVILWISDLFRDRNIEIVDENIFELYPDLTQLTLSDTDSTVKVKINERVYSVKHLQIARLFIFKDISDYEAISNYSRDQATVLGLISIDNFEELTSTGDDNNDLINRVRGAISEYAKANDVLIRRYKSDTYFAVCNHVALEKMEENKFSILKEAHEIGKELDERVTLSIGFAFDFPDIAKLNEMAMNAYSVAESRGGDQAVVSKYGEDLKFFGGNTVSSETTTNVQLRSAGDSIISLITSSKRVFVMGHTELDMDALGACLGIYTIAKHFDIPCSMVVDLKKVERKTKYALQFILSKIDDPDLTINPKAAVNDVDESTLVVVVDTSNPKLAMCEQLLDRANKTMVIDHHRRGEEYIENCVVSFIKPGASSATEMIVETVKYSSANPKIEFDPNIATVMLSGIFLDSNFFKAQGAGIKTFEAAQYLKGSGADNGLADDFLKDEFEEYSLITSIISNMKTPYYGVVYCLASEKDIIERSILAKVCNQVMQLKGVNACFVIGRTSPKEVRISARSDASINVQLLTEKMGGGGHFTSAAASFIDSNIEYAESQLLEVLDEYLTASKANN